MSTQDDDQSADDAVANMDAAADAMSFQLDQLEETNRLQWAEAEAELAKMHAAEAALKEIQDTVPQDQLKLLRARQTGDLFEAQRYVF